MHNPYAPPVEAHPTSHVQFVGRSCDRCRKWIARRTDGIGCRECDLAYHTACLDDPDRCAKCGMSMSAIERAAVDAEAIASRNMLRTGALLVWAAVLPYLLVEIALFGAEISRGATNRLTTTALRVTIDGFLLWATLSGRPWGRRTLAFFSGVTFLIGLAMTASGQSVLGPAFMIVCAFDFWVFAMSSQVRAYLESEAPLQANR